MCVWMQSLCCDLLLLPGQSSQTKYWLRTLHDLCNPMTTVTLIDDSDLAADSADVEAAGGRTGGASAARQSEPLMIEKEFVQVP